MLRQLNTFLVAEGVTDYSFLPVVLERALVELCMPYGVAVAQVEELRVVVAPSETKHEAVCRLARDAAANMTMLFYHYDGSANAPREERKYWIPLQNQWSLKGPDRKLVRVVPVQEMESWVLADLDALRSVTGASRQGCVVYQADRLSRVETLADPKRTMREIVASGRGRRRPHRDPNDYLALIAERLSLDKLRSLPSFQMWLHETEQALRDLELLRD